ncbi:unnamed protein product [Amoebophrya sp. A120]|nr:unnamed protein product [Amoebophrya sp. A120]|eukprot:GSA120T00012427001.1
MTLFQTSQLLAAGGAVTATSAAAVQMTPAPDINMVFCLDIVHSLGATVASFFSALTFFTEWKKQTGCTDDFRASSDLNVLERTYSSRNIGGGGEEEGAPAGGGAFDTSTTTTSVSGDGSSTSSAAAAAVSASNSTTEGSSYQIADQHQGKTDPTKVVHDPGGRMTGSGKKTNRKTGLRRIREEQGRGGTGGGGRCNVYLKINSPLSDANGTDWGLWSQETPLAAYQRLPSWERQKLPHARLSDLLDLRLLERGLGIFIKEFDEDIVINNTTVVCDTHTEADLNVNPDSVQFNKRSVLLEGNLAKARSNNIAELKQASCAGKIVVQGGGGQDVAAAAASSSANNLDQIHKQPVTDSDLPPATTNHHASETTTTPFKTDSLITDLNKEAAMQRQLHNVQLLQDPHEELGLHGKAALWNVRFMKTRPQKELSDRFLLFEDIEKHLHNLQMAYFAFRSDVLQRHMKRQYAKLRENQAGGAAGVHDERQASATPADASSADDSGNEDREAGRDSPSLVTGTKPVDTLHSVEEEPESNPSILINASPTMWSRENSIFDLGIFRIYLRNFLPWASVGVKTMSLMSSRALYWESALQVGRFIHFLPQLTPPMRLRAGMFLQEMKYRFDEESQSIVVERRSNAKSKAPGPTAGVLLSTSISPPPKRGSGSGSQQEKAADDDSDASSTGLLVNKIAQQNFTEKLVEKVAKNAVGKQDRHSYAKEFTNPTLYERWAVSKTRYSDLSLPYREEFERYLAQASVRRWEQVKNGSSQVERSLRLKSGLDVETEFEDGQTAVEVNEDGTATVVATGTAPEQETASRTTEDINYPKEPTSLPDTNGSGGTRVKLRIKGLLRQADTDVVSGSTDNNLPSTIPNTPVPSAAQQASSSASNWASIYPEQTVVKNVKNCAYWFMRRKLETNIDAFDNIHAVMHNPAYRGRYRLGDHYVSLKHQDLDLLFKAALDVQVMLFNKPLRRKFKRFPGKLHWITSTFVSFTSCLLNVQGNGNPYLNQECKQIVSLAAVAKEVAELARRKNLDCVNVNMNMFVDSGHNRLVEYTEEELVELEEFMELAAKYYDADLLKQFDVEMRKLLEQNKIRTKFVERYNLTNEEKFVREYAEDTLNFRQYVGGFHYIFRGREREEMLERGYGEVLAGVDAEKDLRVEPRDQMLVAAAEKDENGVEIIDGDEALHEELLDAEKRSLSHSPAINDKVDKNTSKSAPAAPDTEDGATTPTNFLGQPFVSEYGEGGAPIDHILFTRRTFLNTRLRYLDKSHPDLAWRFESLELQKQNINFAEKQARRIELEEMQIRRKVILQKSQQTGTETILAEDPVIQAIESYNTKKEQRQENFCKKRNVDLETQKILHIRQSEHHQLNLKPVYFHGDYCDIEYPADKMLQGKAADGWSLILTPPPFGRLRIKPLVKFHILRKPYANLFHHQGSLAKQVPLHGAPKYSQASINFALMHLASLAPLLITEVGTYWTDALVMKRLSSCGYFLDTLAKVKGFQKKQKESAPAFHVQQLDDSSEEDDHAFINDPVALERRKAQRQFDRRTFGKDDAAFYTARSECKSVAILEGNRTEVMKPIFYCGELESDEDFERCRCALLRGRCSRPGNEYHGFLS